MFCARIKYSAQGVGPPAFLNLTTLRSRQNVERKLLSRGGPIRRVEWTSVGSDRRAGARWSGQRLAPYSLLLRPHRHCPGAGWGARGRGHGDLAIWAVDAAFSRLLAPCHGACDEARVLRRGARPVRVQRDTLQCRVPSCSVLAGGTGRAGEARESRLTVVACVRLRAGACAPAAPAGEGLGQTGPARHSACDPLPWRGPPKRGRAL